jgi:hypothetical protein
MAIVRNAASFDSEDPAYDSYRSSCGGVEVKNPRCADVFVEHPLSRYPLLFGVPIGGNVLDGGTAAHARRKLPTAI